MVSRLLFKDNRLVLGGGRLAMATPECLARCCEGGCPSWRLLALCDTSPTCDGTPPPNLAAWICTSVRCTNGNEIVANMTIKVDELCWTATHDVRPTPPPGSFVITGNDPVECVDGCSDSRCPPPTLWYPGTPCNGANPPVYFCGVLECGIYPTQYGCYKVDPSNGGIPLPPGALVAPVTGAPLLTCCACEQGCRVCPLVDGAIEDPTCFGDLDDVGIPVHFSRTCCRSARACYRVTRMIGTQTFDPAPFQQPSIITNEWFPGTTGPNGEQHGFVRNTRVIEGVPFIEDFPLTLGGCGLCPVFPILPDREPMALTFTQGATYVNECRSFDPNLTVTQWIVNPRCHRLVHRSGYRFDSGGRIIHTSFIYEAEIIDEDGGLCEGRCAGRGVSAERRNATTAGCSGCGKGLVTTRLA